MIIWSRWGIVVFASIGISVGLGFVLKAIFTPNVSINEPSGNILIGIGFLLGAIGLWAFSTYALPKLDKPKPSFVYEQLPEPYVNERGVKMTQLPVAVVNKETGEQVFTKPTSTFFYIPVRFWPYVVAAIGVFNIIVGIVGD
jgi:hypothetical protein